MMTPMIAAAVDNCAVRAIHAITGEAREDIAAGIAAFPACDGGPAFVGNTVVLWSLGAYRESRGLEVLLSLDRPSIPWTCIISIENPGHCFAIVNGHIHDCGLRYDAAKIDFVFVPPGGAR